MKSNTKRFISLIVILASVAVDQITKIWALNNLAGREPITLIKGFLGLSYVENTGAAFGSFSGKTTALAIITAVIIVLGIAVLFSGKIKSGILYFSVTAVLAGGIGNFIDRIYRSYVVDFLEFLFIDFPVFNFADCLVTVGASLMFIYLIYDMVIDWKKRKEERSTQ